jgi:hypothetical protein
MALRLCFSTTTENERRRAKRPHIAWLGSYRALGLNSTLLDVALENGKDAPIIHDVHHSIPAFASYRENRSGLESNEFGSAVDLSVNTDKWIFNAVFHSTE